MDSTRDEHRGRLSYWLFYTQRCVAYAFAEVMRAHCEERGKPYVITPPQWGALSLLLAQDGLTIGTMSQMRGVDAATGTGIITRLEQNGLLERRHDREDRRVVKVYLTEEGRDIANTLAGPVEQFDHSMKRGFSEGELDRLQAHLQQIIANVSELGPGLGDRFGLLPKDCG
jgi:DNA-binding MarR family transcriptional regulator